MLKDLRETELFQESSPYRETRLSKDDSGSTGVSSLMLLIATILITAIVAGVLVDTVTKLQNQSESTADQALSEVSTGMNTLSVVGDRKKNGKSSNPTKKNIQVVEIIVRLQAGSGPLDMDDVVIIIDDGNATGELLHNSTVDDPTGADKDNFTTEVLRDPEGVYAESNVMEQGTLVKIYIDANAIGLDLEPNTPVDIKLIPQTGQSTQISFTTPSVYTSRKVNLK